MKTPKEIKRGLECCINSADLYNGCNLCPYNEENFVCFEQLQVDALALIQQLEREKEAMMEYTHGVCRACRHFKVPIIEKPCVCCKHNQVLIHPGEEDNWKWRGVEDKKHASQD